MSALQENNNFDSLNFLMGDNSVDMIHPALDNDEPNSTMANQIIYSPKEIILRRIRLYCVNLLWCFRDVHCQQQMPYRKGQLYRFKHTCTLIIALTNQCLLKSKRIEPRLASTLVTPLVDQTKLFQRQIISTLCTFFSPHKV